MSEEPGGTTSGESTSAFRVCQGPPLHEALGILPYGSSRRRICGYRRRTLGGDACSRLKKMALSLTGEVPLRPIGGKPNL